MHRTLLLLLASTVFPALAQPPQAPPPVHSPEVLSDHRVTFRFRDPNANAVVLTREGGPRLPMQKDEQGVWSVTTDPLEPDLYGYSFVADGVTLIDPSNPLMKPNLLSTQSMVHVAGPASLPWEINNVPHGTLHRHFYKSAIVGVRAADRPIRRRFERPIDPHQPLAFFTSSIIAGTTSNRSPTIP